MQDASKQEPDKPPPPRPTMAHARRHYRATDLEVARKIERDRLERERGRQEERDRFVAARGRELFDAWLDSMRLRFRQEAAAEFDAKNPPWTFSRVAAIHLPQTYHYAAPEDYAEQARICERALEEWLAAHPDRRSNP